MRAEQQVGFRTHRGAQLPHESLAELQRFEGELAAIEGRIRSGRIEFERGEPLRQIFRRPLGGEVGILIDVGLVPGPRVDIGVGAQPLVYPAAEELVHRLPGFLADDVPASHFQGRQHRHERQVRMLRVARRVHAPPQRLDVVRILSEQITPEHVLEHVRDHLGVKGQAVRFAHPVHVVIGGELHEHEVAAAHTRLRVACHESPDLSQFHEHTLTADE